MIDYYAGGAEVLERPNHTRKRTRAKASTSVKTKKQTEPKGRLKNTLYNQDLYEETIPSVRRAHIELENKKIKQEAKAQTRRYAKKFLIVGYVFAVLLLISYRYAVINTTFSEKEKLKTELASIQKQNEQLKVNIEQGMNINTIEQEAKEKLGMQKLDNNQKVYISIPKKDYTESSVKKDVTEDENETWWSKLFKDVFNIK